jgi:3',5'-cyclic AMP phosphodiesterase CpdA
MSCTLVWSTDIHLDHLDPGAVHEYAARVVIAQPDALLLGGDISDATRLREDLEQLAELVPRPIHFVLGNHDYYGGSVDAVRASVADLTGPPLSWLPTSGPVQLDDGLALVGHGGWGDARNGDFARAPILSDYLAIEDLVGAAGRANVMAGLTERDALRRRLDELGHDAARTLEPSLREAAAGSRHVVVLTHVPPFPEAAWHDGEPSTPPWQPGFSCRATGDLLQEVATAFPDRHFTVLCGHTHGEGQVEMAPNLEVFTASADYGTARIDLVRWDGEALSVATG